MIELLKLLICISFLAYACRCDLRTRTVPNELWGVVFVVALPLVIADTLISGIGSLPPLLISIISTYVVAYTLFRLNVFGGADGKALVALSFIFPIAPAINLLGYGLPLHGSPHFALTTLTYAILLTTIIPITSLVHNLTTLPLHEILKNPAYSIMGYRCGLSALPEIPTEIVSEPVGGQVWVIPSLPYMLLISAGFIVTTIYGGLLL